MPNTYTLLETVTVGAAGASSITFNSIPQTGYTDLVIKMSTRTTENPGASALGIKFNGASTTVSARILNGTGATVNSSTFAASSGGFGRYDNVTGQAADTTVSTFSNGELYFPNYTSSSFKSFSNDMVTENNGTTAYAEFDAGLWSNTSAITSIGINVYGGGGSFAQYSTFTLYGVSALGATPTMAPKATGGSIIQTDGTYWYHAFLSSGTFTPATNLSCDVLVVAGGGGGGGNVSNGNSAGGGGAGGYRSSTGLSVSTASTVTVGAGGTGGVSGGVGTNGSDSVFSTITSTGGGKGGGSQTDNATSGGSGGGAGGYSASTIGAGNTPSTSPSQGNNGGNGRHIGGVASLGGGGGGASAVGQNASDVSRGGDGGAGSANSISGSSVTYAGGGGGGADTGNNGAGGVGGGAAGGSPPTAATANTGGGGGGTGGYNQNGSNGGSGIVIVRYPV